MAKEKQQESLNSVLGAAIGLSPAAAEARFNSLPSELQHKVVAELRGGDASKIRKAFNKACCEHDKAKVKAAAGKATVAGVTDKE